MSIRSADTKQSPINLSYDPPVDASVAGPAKKSILMPISLCSFCGSSCESMPC